jgi:hypothetical protein
VVLGGSIATAIALIAVGAQSTQTCTASTSSASSDLSDVCESSVSTPFIVSGVVLGLVGGVVGGLLLARKDRANVSAARSKPMPQSGSTLAQRGPTEAAVASDEPASIELTPETNARAWRCVSSPISKLEVVVKTDESGRLVFMAPDPSIDRDVWRCLRDALVGTDTKAYGRTVTLQLSR